MKNTLRILALSLALLLVLPFAIACYVSEPEKAYSYITIDINPSVEIIAEGDQVVSVRAINEDAAVLLSGEALEGLTVKEATEKIVSLAEELGYLNEENTDVSVTVSADSEEQTTEITEKAEEGVKRGSEIAIINRNPRSEDIVEVKELKEKNPELYNKLTPAMHRLAKEVLALNPELTYEELMEMKVSELIELVKTLSESQEDQITDELKDKMDKRHKELKEEAKRKMAKVYGDEYLEKWEKGEDLEGIYNKIEEKVKEIPLSEEDINAILALLNVESVEELKIEGEITVQKIKEYIYESFDEKAIEEIKSELDAILEKYKNEEYKLSEEELEEIKDAMGKEIDFDSLKDLDDVIKEHKEELESLGKDQLTEEQRAELDKIREEMESLGEKLKEEFKEEIADSKEELDRIKEEKRGHR